MALLPKAPIKERIVYGLAVLQGYDAQIMGTGFARPGNLTPKAPAAVRLLLTVERRSDSLSTPRRFYVGPLATHLLIKIARCLHQSLPY